MSKLRNSLIDILNFDKGAYFYHLWKNHKLAVAHPLGRPMVEDVTVSLDSLALIVSIIWFNFEQKTDIDKCSDKQMDTIVDILVNTL